MEEPDETTISIENGLIRTANHAIPIGQVIAVRVIRSSETFKSWAAGLGFIVAWALFFGPALSKSVIAAVSGSLLGLGGFIFLWPQIHDQHRVCVTTAAGERVIAEFDSYSLFGFYDNSADAAAKAQNALNQVTKAMAGNSTANPNEV